MMEQVTKTNFLSIKHLTKSYGGNIALQDVSITINEHEILALIGPNGSGKTVLINHISGLEKPDSGVFSFNKQLVFKQGISNTIAVEQAISRTFQHGRIVKHLSVLDNILMGAHKHIKQTWRDFLLPNSQKNQIAKQRSNAIVQQLVTDYTPSISQYLDQQAGDLSYGNQRLVEIARALASKPKLLLLDEPAAGLNERETTTLLGNIKHIAKSGIAIVVVEHKMGFIRQLSDRVIVLNGGKKICEGNFAEVAENAEVKSAYLGAEIIQTEVPRKSIQAKKQVLVWQHVNAAYTASDVLTDINLTLHKNEIVCLVGNNGAGKTTCLKTALGFIKASAGQILFQEESLHGLKPFAIVNKGIAIVPEGRRIFAELTVQENLQIGAFKFKGHIDPTILGDIMHFFPVLKVKLTQQAGTLSGGEQQMLAIARAMLSKPSILLMDEPSMGLSPRIVSELFVNLRLIHKTIPSILIVEQNVNAVLSVSDRAYVLSSGAISPSDTPDNLRQHAFFQQNYLS